MGHGAIPKIPLALLPVFVQIPIGCEVDLRHISLHKKDQSTIQALRRLDGSARATPDHIAGALADPRTMLCEAPACFVKSEPGRMRLRGRPGF